MRGYPETQPSDREWFTRKIDQHNSDVVHIQEIANQAKVDAFRRMRLTPTHFTKDIDEVWYRYCIRRIGIEQIQLEQGESQGRVAEAVWAERKAVTCGVTQGRSLSNSPMSGARP